MTESSEIVARDDKFVANSMKVRYNPMVIESADGPYVLDADGRRYLDFSSHWSLTHLGYTNHHVRDAVRKQMRKTVFAGGVSNVNRPAADLAEKLVDLAGGGDKKVWYGLSGSDACEAAHRLVTGATGKRRVISFIGSWHGTSDGSMAISGSPAFNHYMLPNNATKVPYPDPYRPPFDTNPKDLTDTCLGYIEEYLFKTISPPEETAAVFVECLQADSGEVVPPPDFMPKLRKLCDRHNLLLVVDDIKIGLGRTGAMFSYQHFGVEPDVLVLGKALGGGLPLSAVIGPSDILDSASSFAGSTNSGNATCCAAGLATVEQVESKNIPRRAYRNGKYLSRRLKQALGRFEIVGDIRGMGMIQGIDLVKDRKTKEPNRDAAAKIVYRAWELGLVCYYAGMFGNIIEITPPMILTRTQIDDGISILEQAIREYLEGDIADEAVAPYSGW